MSPRASFCRQETGERASNQLLTSSWGVLWQCLRWHCHCAQSPRGDRDRATRGTLASRRTGRNQDRPKCTAQS
jgi:hypothetical protein